MAVRELDQEAVQEPEQEAVQVSLLDKILEDVDKLSPQYRVRLIQRVAEKFLPPQPDEDQQAEDQQTEAQRADVQRRPGQLVYGKYADSWGELATEEDFKRAEWYAEDGEAELDDP